MKKIALVLLVIVSSCGETPSYIKGGSHQIGHQSALEITYFKDSRTGLCFAEKGFGNEYTMTCVPCSEEVERLINGK